MSKKIPDKKQYGPAGTVRPAEGVGKKRAAPGTRSYLWLLLAIVAVIAYANTLNNGFALDDNQVILRNEVVKKGFAGFHEIFTTPYHYGWNALNADKLYRPLSLVVFASVYQLFELNPMPYHFVNLLLFAACVVALFSCLDKIFDGRRKNAALIASILFALHPIHTEVVANIKSCDELLCFLFAFLSIHTFMGYLRTGGAGRLLAGGMCLLLSIFAKETSYTFLLIIPLLFFIYRNEHRRRALYITGCTFIIGLCCLLVRYFVLYDYHTLSHMDVTENLLVAPLPFDTRLATIFYILGYYIRLLILPWPLSCDYSIHTVTYVGLTNVGVIASLLGYLFLAVYAIIRFRKDHKDPYAFGIFFYLGNLFLFSNIPFLVGSAMAERFLFFSSVGYCFAVALLIEHFGLRGRETPTSVLRSSKLLAILIPVSIFYLALTISRNADWIDDNTLYDRDLKHMPSDARLHYFVGDALMNVQGTREETHENTLAAIPLLQQAIDIHPGYAKAECDLGIAYARLAQFDSGEKHLLRALQLDPTAELAMGDLMQLYFIP